MNEAAQWLGRVARLRVDRAKRDPAPHKPLLLLVLLELAGQGQLPPERLDLTPELAFRFYSFWPIVAHRRTQKPDVRFPFHFLKGDGLWRSFTEDGKPSPHPRLTRFVEFDPEFRACLEDAKWRAQARQVLIGTYFLPQERAGLFARLGLPAPAEEDLAAEVEGARDLEEAQQQGREARFRLLVVAAYGYTCALTGYRLTTVDCGSIVDAAHIHAFAKSRNNDPRNGMALCKNAHWLFDAGLWSVENDYRIVVAREHFDEESPDQLPLAQYQGKRLRLPRDKALWPDPKFLQWHRKNRFLNG